MASGLYPALGLKLYRASSNPQEPVWLAMREADPVIPSGSSSMGMPLNAGITTSLNVEFAAAPAGTAFNVMYTSKPDFSNEYILDTVAAVALQTLYTWSTTDMIELDGQIRITNAGGQNVLAAYGQQRARMTG